MTEQEWLHGTDPKRLMNYLATGSPNAPRWGDRIQRLIGCAFCRSFWELLPHPTSRKAVEVAERFADGLAPKEELNWSAALEVATSADPDNLSERSLQSLLPWVAAQSAHPQFAWFTPNAVAEAARIAACNKDPAAAKARQALCALLREILGNPFRPVSLDPVWLTWHAGLLVSMARKMYDSRDFSDMPVLADALEEAGCTDQDVLSHCRQQGAVHVRGCWIIDGILNKS